MGFYSELRDGTGWRAGKSPKPDGILYFDADVISRVPGTYERSRLAQGQDIHFGDEVVNIKAGVVTLLSGAYLHWNGSQSRDVNTATLVMSVAVAASASDAVQATLLESEIVPPFENPSNPGRRPGVTRPARG